MPDLPYDPAMRLQQLASKVADGDAAAKDRNFLMRALWDRDPKTWTQSRLARLGSVSQAAVSKLVNKPPQSPYMDSREPHHVIGRWCAVLSFLDEACHRATSNGGTAWNQIESAWSDSLIPPQRVAQAQKAIDRDLATLTKRGGKWERIAGISHDALADVYVHARADDSIGVTYMTPQQRAECVLAYYHQLYTLRSAAGWQSK